MSKEVEKLLARRLWITPVVFVYHFLGVFEFVFVRVVLFRVPRYAYPLDLVLKATVVPSGLQDIVNVVKVTFGHSLGLRRLDFLTRERIIGVLSQILRMKYIINLPTFW